MVIIIIIFLFALTAHLPRSRNSRNLQSDVKKFPSGEKRKQSMASCRCCWHALFVDGVSVTLCVWPAQMLGWENTAAAGRWELKKKKKKSWPGEMFEEWSCWLTKGTANYKWISQVSVASILYICICTYSKSHFPSGWDKPVRVFLTAHTYGP